MTREDQIKAAVAHYETLLRGQVERAEALARKEKKAKKAKTVIGVIDGDGIGPIITQQASRVLRVLLKDEIDAGTVEIRDILGLTIENRLAAGKSIPDDIMAEIKACDVLLKGPTTTPSGGNSIESANVSMRKALDLYANTRPVRVPAEGIDWMFFRENTEGEYALGSSGIAIDDLLTMDFKVTTDAGTRRIVRAAFEYAKKNGKTRVTVVTKSNIMKKTDGMFSRIAREIAADYPGIETDEYFIDIMTANLIKTESRASYQVFVLPNLYGDIITDEAAQIQGGVGTAGSANIGDEYAMFEAIHGSAIRMIETGRAQYANPASILTAAAMLLEHIGFRDKGEKLRAAMDEADKTAHITGSASGATCEEYGTAVLAAL